MSLFDFFKRILEVKMKTGFNPVNPIAPTTQEDPKVHESIKRTRASIKQQETQMNMRALKAHSFDCLDPLSCEKDVCFIREPDKIVHVEVASDKEQSRFSEIQRKNKERLRRMKRSQVRKSV